ncbi:O-methyltransferase-domain-containing protein [Phaeosphaeriaceae sp. PMI808]|nr:O-methyltransferase-domain-containing protein [Phaeosphaeriaceae sp. PMI808]
MASPKGTLRIIELAAQISTHVAELQANLEARGEPTPSFDENRLETLPVDLFHLRDAILDTTAELHELLMDPLQLLFKFASLNNMVSIQAVCRYHIPDMIPPGGQISFDEISQKTGLEKAAVRRLLHNAMSMRILREPEPEMVAHTNVSKFLTIPYINGWVDFESRETWTASTKIVDAIEKWPNSQEISQTGFALANNGKSVQEVVTSDPERAMRFVTAMQAMEHIPGNGIHDVPKAFDWASLGNVQIVNVSGSRGQAAIELANNFGDVKLLVQDSANVIQGTESGVPKELQGRVEFMKHELFEPQTVKAQVYFFRLVLRGLGDKYAVQVLKAQIPALQPGAKILIQDVAMPEPNTIPLWRERVARSVDLAIACYFNGHERYLDEWKALLAEADPRFVLHHVHVPKNSVMSVLEVHWDVSGKA